MFPAQPEDWTKPSRTRDPTGTNLERPAPPTPAPTTPSPRPPSAAQPRHHLRRNYHPYVSSSASASASAISSPARPRVPVCKEPSAVKVCVDLDTTQWYKPPRPPKDKIRRMKSSPADETTPLLWAPSKDAQGDPLWRRSYTDSEGEKDRGSTTSSTRMRIKGDRDKMTMRSEALRYWRSIHNKYSLLNGFTRQRRNAMVKKQRQRIKDRNNMSIVFVLVFLLVFLAILIAEVFFIDEHRSGMLFMGKRPQDFDSMGDIPDYFMDDKKLVGQLEIDTYRRQELSVKGKTGNEERFFRKNVDETHLMARVTGNLVKSVHGIAKVDWLNMLGLKEVDYFGNNSTATDGQWEPVYHTKHKFFVYSAYYDDRKGRIIRVIGATQTKKSDRVWCKYWYSNSSTLIVNGAIKIIRENWNLKFSACFIACPLTIYKNGKQPIPPPESVSVMADPGGNATNKLRVMNLDVNKEGVRDSFAVCVKPLHFDYNNVNQMIEFIELNKILGVEHFTLYNHTIGKEVDCILKSYADQGVINILPWKLDMKSQKEIRTEGLFAALNDCLYRYMYQYKYILMIDLDEYIVPHTNTSLPELMRYLHTKADARKIGAISFQNSFFYLQWPDDPNSASLPPLVTLRKTRRRQRFHPHKQRSKYIAVQPFVVEAGNHFVWEFLPGKGTLNVPNEVAFLHHYRVCEFGGDDCVRNPRTTDVSMYRYKDRLVKSYSTNMAQLGRVCGVEASSKEKALWTLQ
ncbi:uncharacterized protein LOC125027158 isoform X1 [Penaeus chinensis]|uniref:uncharacterized protein LOC125027158 isoform X1 n=2 Tax=Penaeus chinensis TaxID=139456 RepID=UPI001FB71525|nr:uncharacterized protein LOC125027158 isoform X1 [Penaeus chinensis]